MPLIRGINVNDVLNDFIFYWYNNNKLEGLICCDVDDFFWGGTKHFAETVINRLKKTS